MYCAEAAAACGGARARYHEAALMIDTIFDHNRLDADRLAFRRFEKHRPDTVRSIEDITHQKRQKREERDLRKAQRETVDQVTNAIEQLNQTVNDDEAP